MQKKEYERRKAALESGQIGLKSEVEDMQNRALEAQEKIAELTQKVNPSLVSSLSVADEFRYS